MSAVGARGSNGESRPGEHRNGSGSRDSGARVLPRNVSAASMPSSRTGVVNSSASQPTPGVSVSQQPSDSLSSIVAELNSQIRNLVGNMQGEDVAQSGTLPYVLWILVDIDCHCSLPNLFCSVIRSRGAFCSEFIC